MVLHHINDYARDLEHLHLSREALLEYVRVQRSVLEDRQAELQELGVIARLTAAETGEAVRFGMWMAAGGSGLAAAESIWVEWSPYATVVGATLAFLGTASAVIGWLLGSRGRKLISRTEIQLRGEIVYIVGEIALAQDCIAEHDSRIEALKESVRHGEPSSRPAGTR